MKGRGLARLIPALAVVVVLAGIYGLAMSHPVTVSAGQSPPPKSAAVTAIERACPMLGQVTSSGAGIAMIAAPASAGAGRAQLTPLTPGSGGALVSATRTGQLTAATVRVAPPLPAVTHSPQPGTGSQQGSGGTQQGAGGQQGGSGQQSSSTGQGSGGQAGTSSPPVPTTRVRGGAVLQASGSMARGLAAEQTTAGRIPAAPCESPGTDFWFTGPGAHTASRIQLFLANPGDQAADANVEIATDAGPLQGRSDTGITVPPHAMVMQSLAPVIGGSRVVALHVRTSVGQVAAAVQEIKGTGGGSWLPAAQMPARRMLVPGLPATSGTRQLFLAVPGERDAHVTISAVTSRGTYQPTGGGGIDVPAGSAISITLPSLSGIPAAIKLGSNVPVTAAAMISGGATGAPGLFTAAAPAIGEQGVVAANLAGGGESSELILTAPGGAAKARITEFAAGSPGTSPASKVVKVKAHKSRVVSLPQVKGARPGSAFSVAIVPLPGSGPMYAGRLVMSSQTATAQALQPVSSALTRVPLPPVSNGLGGDGH